VRVECESCRELVVASLAIDGHTVRATCPVCRHVMSVPDGTPEPAPEPAPEPGIEGSPEQAVDRASAAPVAGAADTRVHVPGDAIDDASLCPKCGAVRDGDAAACGSCGLRVARMAEYIDARDAAVPEPVREAWTRAVAAWGDDARHDELLQLVATHHAYAWAAGRYRTRGDDPVARHQLERLRRAAEATLLVSATARPAAETRPYRGTAGVLAVLVVVMVVGLLYAVVIRDHPSSHARSLPPGAAGTPGAAGGVRPLVPGHPVSPSTIK
jgi:hypothetical protein